MRITRKFQLVLLSLITVYSISFTNIVAHSPDSVNLQYDFDTNRLNVTISHSVDDPESHYVETIRIFLNDSQIANQTIQYTSQPNEPVFTYSYDLVAGNGTKIQVIASCNVEGSQVGFITIGALDTSIPLKFSYIFLFFSIGVVITLLRIKKLKVRD